MILSKIKVYRKDDRLLIQVVTEFDDEETVDFCTLAEIQETFRLAKKGKMPVVDIGVD